jgi:hypothetical protein
MALLRKPGQSCELPGSVRCRAAWGGFFTSKPLFVQVFIAFVATQLVAAWWGFVFAMPAVCMRKPLASMSTKQE